MRPPRPALVAAGALALAALLLWVVLAVRSVDGLGEDQAGPDTPSGTPPVTTEPEGTEPETTEPTTQTETTQPTTEPDAAPTSGPVAVTPPPSSTATPTPEEEPPGACVAAAAELDEADLVGQLFMLSKDSTTPVDESYRALLDDTRPGSLLLLGETHAGVDAVRELTDALREAAPAPEDVGVLVAADQEGGLVQRLQGPGFDRIPTAVEQARMSDADLRAAAEGWGAQLRAAGVDAALAPVADVVPAADVATNEPIGRLSRHYGESAEEVAPKVAAFVAGMDEAGVATSLKHFPGLGRVVGNTDFTGDVVDTVTGPDDDSLRSFAGPAGERTDMIMVATAVYERIDPGVPAAFSPVVIEELLRGDLGFDRVVIADDLGVAEQVAQVPPGERALRFLHAGGDIVINAAPGIHREMVEAVRAELAEDPDFAEDVRAKAARILAMKERRGIADCG